MPQVDAIRALAQPDKRPGGEGARKDAAGLDTRRDDREAQDGAQDGAAPVHEGRVTVAGNGHDHEARQGEDADRIDRAHRVVGRHIGLVAGEAFLPADLLASRARRYTGLFIAGALRPASYPISA